MMQVSGSLVISTDPSAFPKPIRWKTFCFGCSVSCGFKFRSARTRLESPKLAAAHMKGIWRFQLTTSIMGSTSVTVAENMKMLVGCLNGQMGCRSGKVTLQGLLAGAGPVWRNMPSPEHHVDQGLPLETCSKGMNEDTSVDSWVCWGPTGYLPSYNLILGNLEVSTSQPPVHLAGLCAKFQLMGHEQS